MKTKIHAAAGLIAFLTILSFWTSTAVSELFGSHEAIATVKAAILKGMFILIPAMAIVGASGMALGGKRTDALATGKKKRMPIIAANGLLVLVPAAFYLEAKASAGDFDMAFYSVQIIELLAGATNLTLMGRNIRDGLKMTGKIGHTAAPTQSPRIELRDAGPVVVKGLQSYTDASGTIQTAKPAMALCRCGASKTKPFCDGSHNDIGFDSRPSDAATPDELIAYAGKDITVHYNRLLCSHAGVCGAQLKQVFDSDRKPWITPDNSTPEAVIDVVNACPSGALSYSMPGDDTPTLAPAKDISLKIEPDGPLHVSGIPMLSPRLAKGASAEKYVLCRCGASKNKPYCDGTHHDIGWTES